APIPAHPELYRYFRARLTEPAPAGSVPTEERVEEAIRRFSQSTVQESRRALTQASTLRQLGKRLSPEELGALTPEGRAKWIEMLIRHCRILEEITVAMRTQLKPVFSPPLKSDRQEQVIEIKELAELTRWTERLFELVSANDELIGVAFSVSPNGTSG